MSEKLIIKNFGPIKDVELELKRFNVLIGENATGKSTVAKLLGFCKYFSNIEGPYFDEENNEQVNHGIDEIYENLQKWGLSEYIRPHSYVSYECDDYRFVFDYQWNIGTLNPYSELNKKKGAFLLASYLYPKTNVFRKLIKDYATVVENDALIPEFYINFVGKVMDNPFLLFTERGLQSIFSLGKDFSSNLTDPLFRYFVNVDRITRLFKEETQIEPLHVYYKNVDGKSVVRKNDEETFVSLHDAASGYKSLIPIVLLVKYYKDIRRKKKSFIIEEPEQNLFPKAQYELVKFLVEQSFWHNSFLVTTHSPYILTSLNNLMYAFELGQHKNREDKVESVIDNINWLNPKNVSAYRLLNDGTARNIIDMKEGLINADEIDEVSNILNDEFDKLIEIEHG